MSMSVNLERHRIGSRAVCRRHRHRPWSRRYSTDRRPLTSDVTVLTSDVTTSLHWPVTSLCSTDRRPLTSDVII